MPETKNIILNILKSEYAAAEISRIVMSESKNVSFTLQFEKKYLGFIRVPAYSTVNSIECTETLIKIHYNLVNTEIKNFIQFYLKTLTS